MAELGKEGGGHTVQNSFPIVIPYCRKPVARNRHLGYEWSVSQMLDHFGEEEWGKRVLDVIEEMLVNKDTLTPDLGGTAKTDEVGERVCALLEKYRK